MGNSAGAVSRCARITVELDCGPVVAVVMGVDTGVAIGIEVAKGIESG